MPRSRSLEILALAAGLLATTSSSASADVVWRGGFEPGDLSEWNEFTGPVDDRISIVEDPVRDGMFAARVEIRPGDLGNGDLNRVEMGYHPPGGWGEGTERWYAWSMMMPDDVVIGDGWHLLTYFEAEVLYTNAMSFRLYGDGMLSFCTFVGGEVVHWSAPFEQGAWHDFVLHVLWSPDAATGVVELWYDDELVLPATNVATMHVDGTGTPQSAFLHQGVLRYEQITDTEVFFFDGTVEATALEDVMPVGGTTGDDDGATETSAADTSGAGTNADDTATTNADDTAATNADDTATNATASTTNDGEGSTGDAAETDDDDSGCSCTASPRTPGFALLLAGLGAVVTRRRRPRCANG